MACSHRNSSTTLVRSQKMLRHGELEPTTVRAKEDRTKIKPQGMRDCVHVDPEHVWGDEGPMNEYSGRVFRVSMPFPCPHKD